MFCRFLSSASQPSRLKLRLWFCVEVEPSRTFRWNLMSVCKNVTSDVSLPLLTCCCSSMLTHSQEFKLDEVHKNHCSEGSLKAPRGLDCNVSRFRLNLRSFICGLSRKTDCFPLFFHDFSWSARISAFTFLLLFKTFC